MTSAVDRVRAFRGLRALCIGDVLLDSYYEGTAARLCAEGPVPVVRKTAEEHLPGGAANTAANLRALGAEVTLLGLVGTDSAGALLRRALQAAEVDGAGLVADAAVATLHKLRILADGQYVVRFDQGDTAACSAQARAALVARLEAALPRADLVVLSDYGYGVASPALLERLTTLLARAPRVLAVDSKRLAHYARVPATVVTPNHVEARLAVGAPPSEPATTDPAAVAVVGRQLLARLAADWAAITCAAQGVVAVGRAGAALHIPACPVAQPHDIGAGDSFLAALALALGASAPMEEATRIAVEAAGIAVSKPRTAVVSQQELLQRLSLRALASAAEDPVQAVARLAEQLAAERQRGRRVVFTNGVFDLLHAGHVEFLRRARELGDLLVVGVNTDRSARLLKGAGRPIMPERERLAVVAALDAVDHAILFDDPTPTELIRLLRPDVHVKGGDYRDVPLPEAEAVAAVGGQVVILPLAGDQSTTSVIERVLALALGANGGRP
ncbi:MAG: bifunctional heptose 7-phosphate kinase/heptose 1-phosphate adenyltransferase [Chloroflexi bacterium]|nr:bifunctional heptose 7-phosphate kinase/heptose 1-phosphate adenyltransferase [Chloroflexota bacterium]